MTLELWNTFATLGTFIVIAATAIAALIQLRHTRGSNQIAALSELVDKSSTPRFTEAERLMRVELPGKLADPEFRYQIANRDTRTHENRALLREMLEVGNFYENIGLLLKMGLVDRELAVTSFSSPAISAWDSLESICAIQRPVQGEDIWENFEYFVVLAQDWISAHPHGAYPAGARRIPVSNKWQDADRQYAASRPA